MPVKHSHDDSGPLRYASLIEHGVLWILLGLLLVVAVLATIQLAVDIVGVLLTREGWIVLSADELFFVFEAFFLVLIALELLETVRVYIERNRIAVEIIILVAITAVARKIIVLNVEKYDPVTVIGLAALVIALTGGYFLIRRTMSMPREEEVEV